MIRSFLSEQEVITRFQEDLTQQGLLPENIIADGKIHRFSTNSTKVDDAGWYVISYVNGIAVGAFGDWRSGLHQRWSSHDRTLLSPAEQVQFKAQRNAVQKKLSEERTAQSLRAKLLATEVLKVASPPRADHPYLIRKKVLPLAVAIHEITIDQLTRTLGYTPSNKNQKLAGRILIAPVYVRGELSTLEFIDEKGLKSTICGGVKKGGYWTSTGFPQGDGTGLIFALGEGIATMLSILQATGFHVLASLSCHNLPSVACFLRQRYPMAMIFIAADQGNGIKDAEHAAIAIGGIFIVPDFTADEIQAFQQTHAKAPTDFNDLALLRGEEFIKKSFLDIADAHPNKSASAIVDVTAVTNVKHLENIDCSVTEDCSVDDIHVTHEGLLSIPESERPCFKVFEEYTNIRESKHPLKPGVWYFSVQLGRGDDPAILKQNWVCSPLYVVAITSDSREQNFGRLLRFRNTFGSWQSWAMPMEILSGNAEDLRKYLLRMGVDITTLKRNLLPQYLQSCHPNKRILCALQIGWNGRCFVLPEKVIGANADNVIFQSRETHHNPYRTAGTLAGWQKMSALAIDNPVLMLTISASFAAPILALCNLEGGGIHLVGDSSTGKTAAVEAACATWGGASFRRSWKATANGIEGASVLFNDGLLALDEINECDPKEIGSIIYSLGNGRGKQRATQTGGARDVNQWRCLILSSGERTISTTILEGGQRAKAGQLIRLLDVPVSRHFGAWDKLHGFASGQAFSDEIKRMVTLHHGHAGILFLERLTRDERDFHAALERIKSMPDFMAREGQEQRAAARFAIIGLAGEIATEYGITNWPPKAAIAAAAEGFKSWLSMRKGGNDERRQIPEQLSEFLERYGDSRFSSSEDRQENPIRDRAGWWRTDGAGRRIYFLLSSGMREALKGFDFHRSLNMLQAAGVLLVPPDQHERSSPQRMHGRLVRVYSIDPDKLQNLLGG